MSHSRTAAFLAVLLASCSASDAVQRPDVSAPSSTTEPIVSIVASPPTLPSSAPHSLGQEHESGTATASASTTTTLLPSTTQAVVNTVRRIEPGDASIELDSALPLAAQGSDRIDESCVVAAIEACWNSSGRFELENDRLHVAIRVYETRLPQSTATGQVALADPNNSVFVVVEPLEVTGAIARVVLGDAEDAIVALESFEQPVLVARDEPVNETEYVLAYADRGGVRFEVLERQS